jgi:tetratricopeptide (TPR) repeat protein
MSKENNVIEWPLLNAERVLLEEFILRKKESAFELKQSQKSNIRPVLLKGFDSPEQASNRKSDSISTLDNPILNTTDLVLMITANLTKDDTNMTNSTENEVRLKSGGHSTIEFPISTHTMSPVLYYLSQWWQIGLVFFLVGVASAAILLQQFRAYMEWNQSKGAHYVDRLQQLVQGLAESQSHAQVVQLLQRSLPRVVQYRGASHIDVAALQHLQARAHLSLGQWLEAQTLLLSVLTVYQAFGEDVHLAGAYEDSGIALHQLGCVDDSVAILRMALRIYREEAEVRSSSFPAADIGSSNGHDNDAKVSNAQLLRTPVKESQRSLEAALDDLESLLGVDGGEGGSQQLEGLPTADCFPVDESVARTLHRIGMCLSTRSDDESQAEALRSLRSALALHQTLLLREDGAMSDKTALWTEIIKRLNDCVDELEEAHAKVKISLLSGCSPNSVAR